MLTSSHFWVGFVAAIVVMYLWHKYQLKKMGG